MPTATKRAILDTGVAIAPMNCGNAILEGAEECDDGNTTSGDGCSSRCRAEAKQVVSSGLQTCIVTSIGGVKCWGENNWGQLGYGDTNNRGDEPGEMGANLQYVGLGGSKAVKVAPGKLVTCALLEDGSVKCWGKGGAGAKPDTMGARLRPEPLAERAVAIDAQDDICVVLASGEISCMSRMACGNLGFSTINCDLRAQEYVWKWSPVLGKDSRRVVQITAGLPDCALLDDGAVKCWGASWPAVGHSWKTMRSGIFKKKVPDVPLKTTKKVTFVASNFQQVCVIFDTGEVGCWGEAASANALGYYTPEKNENSGQTRDFGDPPGPEPFWHAGLPEKPMRFEVKARTVLPSPDGGCVWLEDNRIKCWQEKSYVAVEEASGPIATTVAGQITTPPMYTIKMPKDCLPIDLSMAGNFCVLCNGGCLKCWGDNSNGQLGYGDTKPRKEPPEGCVDY